MTTKDGFIGKFYKVVTSSFFYNCVEVKALLVTRRKIDREEIIKKIRRRYYRSSVNCLERIARKM